MVCKTDVVDWFKGLSASNRIDTMCLLMDHCLSFELRFLGTVIENLGRRDFHELRDADHKANSFFADNTNERIAILNLLSEPPIACANSNSHFNVHHQNPSANSFNQSSHHNFHNNVNDTSTNRPSPTHTNERKTRSPGPGGGQSLPPPHATEAHLPSMGAIHSSSESSYASTGSKPGHHMTSGNTNVTSAITNCRGNGGDEDDEYKSDSNILTDDTRRRKLIMYLSLLNATNRDCAKAYFGVLSEIKDVLSVMGWLDGLDDTTLEEMALLFTIGNNHPAFTFEQRTFLGDIMEKFQSQITKLEVAVGKTYQQTFVIPHQANNYYFLPQPHYISPGQAPPGGNNPTPENGRTVVNYLPYLQMIMPYHPQVPQQTAHPYAQNLVGAAISPQAAAGSPVTPTQSLVQQQSVPLSGPSSSSSSSSVQQFPKPQQAGSQSQQSSVSTPTRTSSMASAVTAFQSQTNSLDGNESEEYAWDSPESSPFESPPQSLTPSRSDSPTTSQTNTVTQSSVASPTLSAPNPSSITLSNSSSAPSCSSVPESLCSTVPATASSGGGGLGSSSSSLGLNCGRPTKIGPHAPVPLPVMHGQEVVGGSKTLNMTMSMNGLKISMPDRRSSKPLSSYHSNHNSTPNQLLSSMVLPLSGTSTSSGPVSSTHGMAMTSLSNNPSSSQHSCHSQSYVHSSQSQSVNNGGYSSGNSTSITNVSAAASSRTVSVSSTPLTSNINSGNSRSNSVSASAYNHLANSSLPSASYHHPVAMPIPQQHHPQSNASCDGSNPAYGNTLKGCISVPPHTRLKSVNSGSNPSNAMNSTSMLPSQQMMGQVQVQNPPPTAVNSVGVGTHSISSNPSLVAYQHGPLTHGGPQINNYGGVAGYSNVGAPPYSSMGFRSPNNQQTLLNRAAAGYLPQHSNAMISNQMVMKQQQDQRSHNLNPNLSHGRGKTNNSSVQAQNTPKRRNNTSNSSSNTSNSNSNVGSNGGNQHLQNKGEDTTEKDRANGVPVVSANPMKSSQQQQERGKSYHHQGMPMSNGPLGTGGNSSNSTGISSNSATPNSVVLNSNSGQAVGSVSVNTGPTGSQALHCAASKTDENLIGDGLLDYPVSTSIASLPAYAGSHMFGPGPGATAYVAINSINGYLPPPFYSPISASVVSSGSQQVPPSTEIMANPAPGHAYNFPFTIPPYHPQQMANKAGPPGTNSVVSKDLNKVGAADTKMMGASDLCITYGRNVVGAVPQSAAPLNSPLMAYPMVSPSLPQQPRGRYIQDVLPGNDLAISGIEQLLPPPEDQGDVNQQRRLSCYNCGAQTHLGPECKETTIEEMTRHPYRLNYNPQQSPNSPSDSKDE